MKKILFVLSLCALFNYSSAQHIAQNAIGIRLSDSFLGDEGFGPEITYQKKVVSEQNRIDLHMSLRTNSWVSTFRTGGYFHWSYQLVDKLSWYVGPGAGIGLIDFKDRYYNGTYRDGDNSRFFLYIGGDIGLDYTFDFPLQISVGLRPTLDIHDIESRWGYDVDNHIFNFGVAARYIF
ncbi:hypothetical protein ACFSTE_19215 [Aquimarina hainanensis]|uniref:Outer membrane protein beta-barrel domain-containing protein n=1 Tax=Aquimarina hainanensis TaxID=1578017 RepID=A0ABW5ND39_9FLAO|nr:hypothetical protein [Aquimarina sp. TRL1]QKX06544.1 hypothetical protein HN014_17035 [Aquimarina sp. TRL1]